MPSGNRSGISARLSPIPSFAARSPPIRRASSPRRICSRRWRCRIYVRVRAAGVAEYLFRFALRNDEGRAKSPLIPAKAGIQSNVPRYSKPLGPRPRGDERIKASPLIRPVRDSDAAAGPVGDLHLVLPRQPVFSGREIAHVGVGAILCAAFHRHIAAMAELVDVVLHAPDPAC